MGNIECCHRKRDIEEIESKEEIFIRETLYHFTKAMVNREKLNKLMQKQFSIMLLDIEGPPLEWISEESYNEFIYTIFNKKGKLEFNENKINYISLRYSKVKNITLSDYSENNFHLLLCMWLIGISPSKTISDEEKIEMIKCLILKCNKYITYKTFSKFLVTFIEMMLIEITYNFYNHNANEVIFLLKYIYNNSNINEYCKWHCWKLGKILTKNKKKLLSDTKAINNEFIKDEHLNIFFKKYSYLLRPIELRNNFYKKYK